MNDEIRTIVGDLRNRLERLYAKDLHRVVLYGSHCRSGATVESDIDVLVVLSGEVNAAQEISRTIDDVSEISLRHNVVISCMFISRDEYEKGQGPLLTNVQREGIAI